MLHKAALNGAAPSCRPAQLLMLYSQENEYGTRVRKTLLLLICSIWALNVHAGSLKANLIADLAKADSVQVFSLAPMKSRGVPAPEEQCAGSCFRGWLSLGQVSVLGTKAQQISNSLIRWVKEPVPKALASCFTPRHGARVVSNGHTYDFVLCFECGGGRVYMDEETAPYAYLYSPGQGDIWNLLLDAAQIERERPRGDAG